MGSDKKLGNAILKTLIYSDIFSYPMVKDEIWKFLIWEEKNPPLKKNFLQTLSKLNLKEKEGYYFLPGKEKIVSLRKKRKAISDSKKENLKKNIALIKKIPTVKLIGISGSLSMDNSDYDDDIDLFLITKKNTLWLTRLLVIILLEVKGIRRRPGEKDISGKICLNMLIDENNLLVSGDSRNLYLAHEVIQMHPLYDKDNTYQKFLSSNLWVRNYLPNSIPKIRIINNKKDNIFQLALHSCPEFVEWIALCTLNCFVMLFQLLYMINHRTSEEIGFGIAKFHPGGHHQKIKKIFEQNQNKIFALKS